MSLANSSVTAKKSLFASPGVRLGSTVGLPDLTENDTKPKSTWSSYFNPLSYSYNPVNLFRSRAPASASEAPATPVAPATTSVTGAEKQSEADTAATKSTWGQTFKSAINPMTYVNYLTPSYFKAKPPGDATPASQSATEVASSAAVTETPQMSSPQSTFGRLRSMYKTRVEPGVLGRLSDDVASHSAAVMAHLQAVLSHMTRATRPSLDEFTKGFVAAMSMMTGVPGTSDGKRGIRDDTESSVGKTDIVAESAVSAAPPAEAATASGRTTGCSVNGSTSGLRQRQPAVTVGATASVAPTDVTIPNTKV